MKALTGVTIQEFDKLSEAFTLELKRHDPSKNKDRKRREGGGRHHTLGTPAEKLFFILFYVKCYPTFDVLRSIFHVDCSQPCRWVQAYLPVLEATLGREVVLPVRKISNIAEFTDLFPEIETISKENPELTSITPKSKPPEKALSEEDEEDTRQQASAPPKLCTII